MNILRIGGEFDGGKIVGINRHGVLTVRGEYMRFYPQTSVETMLSWKQQGQDTVKGVTKYRGEKLADLAA
jgi:hypothetical protein